MFGMPKIQPNGLYPQDELEDWATKVIANALLTSLALNIVGMITVNELIKKIRKDRLK
jgi:hypothetical protein